MKMPCPVMVITLKLYSFHFSLCEINCLILIVNFQHLNLLKLAEFFVKLEMEMRPAPPQPVSMKSGHRSNP